MKVAGANDTLRHDCLQAVVLSRLLAADELDAALEAGLMAFVPCPACDAGAAAELQEAQRKIADAWAARDRYRARNTRLERLESEREARRARSQVATRTALPAAVTAVLERAKARAAERGAK
ncbi:hypothetical protein [Pseudoxanthomonas gei]|uniref:hypothetical protein n=1 Tax=Pseudoxanthomonas gei TaxID=1383030 RepID=UPI001FE244B7|nr:hypothetical protein [Pseudoxanthomonas gei]